MKWQYIIAMSTCHLTPLSPSSVTTRESWPIQLSFPVLFFLLSSLYPLSSSHFHSQNQSHSHAVFSSYTQPELWMHSPLIRRMSYLSLGTIATECSMAQSYSQKKVQKKMFCSHKAVGHCIQQHQPSSLSLLHMKSSSLFVEKSFQLLCVWLSVEMEFLLLQCNWQPEQMTSRICACCHCVSMLICRLSFVCSPWSGIN